MAVITLSWPICFFEYFKTYCNLQPQHNILDIGSGIGRMAVPFIEYFDDNGRYEGIDVVKIGINWCNKAYFKNKSPFQIHPF